MISDAQAQRLLPRKGWLRRWVEYASTVTDAPMFYHFGAALNLLSVAAPKGLHTMGPGGMRIQPNLYVLLAGRSVVERKSAVCGMVGRALENSPLGGRLGVFADSPQSMIKQLGEQPLQLWINDEWSTFLAQASKRGSHVEPVKNALTQAYDGGRLDRATFGKGVHIAKDYRLSLQLGCSVSYLQQYLTHEDKTGGFLARLTVFYAQRTRFIPWSRTLGAASQDTVTVLTTELDRINRVCPEGLIQFSPGALHWLEYLSNAINKMQLESKELTQGFLGRIEVNAVKMAMLIATDWYATDRPELVMPTGEPLIIDEEVMRLAIGLTWAHAQSAIKLLGRLRADEFNRWKDRVTDLITKPGVGYTIAQIIQGVELGSKRRHFEVLETLEAQGILAKRFSSTGDTEWFRTELPPSEPTSLPSLLPEGTTAVPDLEWFQAADAAEAAKQPVPMPPVVVSNRDGDSLTEFTPTEWVPTNVLTQPQAVPRVFPGTSTAPPPPLLPRYAYHEDD